MTVINRESDVPIFGEISMFGEYLKYKIREILGSIGTDTLNNAGSIFIVNVRSDWEQAESYGLSRPLKEYSVEYSERLAFSNRCGGIFEILHGCICISNDCAIDVFCRPLLMPLGTYIDWIENISEE